MCGIVGIAGNLFAREEQTMKRLLLLDSLRGMDSTGLAAVKLGGNKVQVSKTASHCFNLFDKKSFSEALNGIGSLAFIGHNRSATVGGIKDVNAHPFQIDHITGAHNGTLEDRDKKMLEDWVGEVFNTDSEALYSAIAKFGIEEVIPKLTKGRDHYKGAWSLIWWNSEDRTLNFLRNSHRPLWYCFSKDCKQVFWASEFWMLDAALQKNGGNYELYLKESTEHPGKSFRFFQTKEDVWYSVDIQKLSKGSKDRPEFKAKKLAGKEPEAAGTSYPFVSTVSGTHGTGCGTAKGSKGTGTTTRGRLTTSSSIDGPVTLRGDINKPYAGYFTRVGFAFLGNTRSSKTDEPQCSWCHESIPFGQPGLWIVTRDNIILCSKCNGNEPVSALSDYAPPTRVIIPRAALNQLR